MGDSLLGLRALILSDNPGFNLVAGKVPDFSVERYKERAQLKDTEKIVQLRDTGDWTGSLGRQLA